MIHEMARLEALLAELGLPEADVARLKEAIDAAILAGHRPKAILLRYANLAPILIVMPFVSKFVEVTAAILTVKSFL